MRFRNYRKADLILWLIRIGSVQFRGRFAEQLLALCANRPLRLYGLMIEVIAHAALQ